MKNRAAVLLTLCAALAMGVAGSGAPAQEAEQPSLSGEFSRAADEYGVPQELLRAMGYVNTGWEMPPPSASPYEPEDPHGRGAYGLMQLQQNPSKNTLGRAADLTGLTEEELKNDRAANVRGGAAVLADIAGQDKPSDLDGWFDVVAEYGSSPLYAQQVYERLQDGASRTTSDGEKLELAPRGGVQTRSGVTSKAGGQAPGSTWYGAHGNNYYASRTDGGRTYDVNKIVVHTMQGSWSGSLSWFQDGRAGSSAHYSVSRGGSLGQSVREEHTAYHAGDWQTNLSSVGIEHEGYVSNPGYWYTESMYKSSARLAAYLAKKHRIPIDRSHIIGHHEVPGCSGPGGGASCHTDPGSGWNWTKYMNLVKGYAGGGTSAYSLPGGGYKQAVDNKTSGRFLAASVWGASTWNTKRYGANYRYVPRSTAVARPARFKVNIPATGQYEVFGWWPSNAEYTNQAVYSIATANGWTRRVVNQKYNGGKWVSLGTYKMNRGDGWRVMVSSKSPGAGKIMADAVGVVER